MIDTAELLRAVDLGALIERDLGPACNRSGRWLFWPCPFHNDSDPSFAVTPDNGRYHCFGCGASGDAITWLREREGLSFRDACDRLEALDLPAHPVRVTSPMPDDEPPSVVWQERAARFVADCERTLWSARGTQELAYLRNTRDLTDVTIRRWRLGCNPAARWEKPEVWGLDAEARKVWLPRGVTIPCWVDGVLWYVKMRRPAGRSKYWGIRGGKSALFGGDLLGGGPVVLLCEGEFDAMLLLQEAGDLVGVAALGGASKRIGARWIVKLLEARRILAAFDTDLAGEEGAARLLLQYERMRRVHPLRGRDLTDFHQAGGNLRAWVVYHLERMSHDTSESTETVEEHWELGETGHKMSRGRTDEMDDMIRIEVPTHASSELIMALAEAHSRWPEDPPPTEPCGWFRTHRRFWRRPSGGWECATCYPPPPELEVEMWEIPAEGDCTP